MAPQVASLSGGWHQTWHDVTGWFGSLGAHIGPLGVAAFVLAAVGLLGYALITLASRSGHDLEEALRPYQLKQADPTPAEEPSPRPTFRAALKRLAEALNQLAERRGFRRYLAERLVRAGVPMGVGEALVVLLGIFVLLGIVGLVLAGPVGLLIGLVLAVVVPLGALQFLVDRRTAAFEAQLPDVLKLLSGALRAGFSLLQGLDAVANQVKDPMRGELRQAMMATRLGSAVEDAMDATATRIGSRDFQWAVMAIRIQREVGGNLAEILDTVADTMIQRQRLRREVRTLTSEGRLSAWILGVLPFAIGGFVYLVNRAYISTLFHSLGGEMTLMGGLVLELLGIWWLSKTIRIEV